MVGRPSGGVVTLIRNSLHNLTSTICCTDRCAMVKISNYVIIGLYLPCSGTQDCLLLRKTIFDDIWSWREQHGNCNSGNFNVYFDSNDVIANFNNSFSLEHSLTGCNDLFPRAKTATYNNSFLNHQSCIDYMLVSSSEAVGSYYVVDPDTNFSDRLPLFASFECSHPPPKSVKFKENHITSPQLPWDHADSTAFYEFTKYYFKPM